MKKDNDLNHLAIIMDGNGRWAKSKGKLRTYGHKIGAEKIREITKYVAKSPINYLTLYAFSTENWNRPKSEVDTLMKLLEKYLKNEKDFFLQNNVRFDYIGDCSIFSDKIKKLLNTLCEETKHCTSLTQVLALNYGAKDELVRAINKIKHKEINEDSIKEALDISVDVDLLIRTGGEQRISNYLLWQSAYAELWFSPTLWPEFSTEELGEIILKYKKAHRRFGGL